MIFSMTIDYDKNGKLSLWYQRREHMTPAQEKEFNDLRDRLERIVQSKVVPKEFEFDAKTAPAHG